MFSGIVECIGHIVNITDIDGCKEFIIKSNVAFTDLKIGDSVAVNGVCLTVTRFDQTTFTVTAVPQTLRLTNLSTLEVNEAVNLERAISADARIGGHFVQGHIDGTGKITDIRCDASTAWIVTIEVDASIAKYLIPKGFVTLDGMSITVIETAANYFTVTLIPHTQAVTIAEMYRINTILNIEVDMMAKYAEKYIQAFSTQKNAQNEGDTHVISH